MTHAVEARRLGREPITIVELDLDYCTLTYGVAPCMAALGFTGDDRCYNTRFSCQDPDNYTPAAKTYRFCTPVSNMPASLAAIPSVKGFSSAPTKLDIGASLGQRASVNITFQDHTHHDRGVDKYWDLRRLPTTGGKLLLDAAATSKLLINSTDYLLIDDESSEGGPLLGTFWGRLRARNPYYVGRELRLKTGYIVDGEIDDANFITYTYLIETINWPDSKGQVVVVAKDPLKLADNERAQAPAPNSGLLLADISDSATTATLTPAGVGNDEYAASGFVSIGSEVMAFTRVGDVLTFETTDSPPLNGRAQYGTVAAAHSADDTVQQCLIFDGDQVQDISYILLTEFAAVPLAYIDKPAWDAEADAYLTRLYSACIPKPTGVRQLLGELVEQVPFYIWWNERETLIELRAIREPDATAQLLTDDANLVAGSVAVVDKPADRRSQVWVHFGQIDPTKSLTDLSNYAQTVVDADPDAEAADRYGQAHRQVIFSRWISVFAKAAALELAAQLRIRNTEIPKAISFSLDAKDSTIWTGDVVRVQTRLLPGFDGAPETVFAQVIEAVESRGGHSFNYTAQVYDLAASEDGTDRIPLGSDVRDVNLWDVYLSLRENNGEPVDVTFVIESGVVIGSTSSDTFALTVGGFPDGSSVRVENNGRILGAGGIGADQPQNDGGQGGSAMLVDFPITLDNNGIIGAGGGGGGSGGNGFFTKGGGGAGGAGDRPGPGGSGDTPGGIIPGGDGTAGTETDGGTGGPGHPGSSGAGGDGGDLAMPGANGGPGDSAGGGLGGAAGDYAIYGYSLITFDGAAGDIRGNTGG